MERVTQQSAANAEESAAAGEELTAQAGQLKRYVADLDSLIGGKASGGNGAVMQQGDAPVTQPAGMKSSMVRTLKKTLGRKGTKPEEVIPFDKGDFKDF